MTTGARVFPPVAEPAAAASPEPSPGEDLAWSRLPFAARAYVACVIACGASAAVALLPRVAPDPWLFSFVLVTAAITSAWKLNLPIPLASGATLSVSYAADMMALLLLGPRTAVVVAAVGVWVQCTVNVKKAYPLYRTVFSTAAEAITMAATGATYVLLGGQLEPNTLAPVTRAIVAAIAAYFCVNTGLVAGAIALSTDRSAWRVWRDEFAWSAASFLVAGSAGACAAIVIDRGWHWQALLLLGPVYLTYRTYRLFVARLNEQRQHVAETEQLHATAMSALEAARAAEHGRALLLEREQAARASAEAANRLKDQFLATVSHELRTPLNAILGWAEMLKTGSLEPSRLDRAYEAILNNAKRQARLIEELLDVSRIMSGKLRIDRGVVKAADLVAGAIETVQLDAEAKEIRLLVEVDPRVTSIRGDGPRLQQVLWNLLSNAVKFTSPGGTVTLRVRPSGIFAEIVVSDTGCGIPRDFLEAAFEPFRQADGSPTRLHGGLGLGLAIVKHLVDAHGGSVSAESPGPGQGATFTVRVPMALGTARLRADTSLRDRSLPALPGLTVLVVDDDEESRMVVSMILTAHGARPIAAASSAEALGILASERVDVLLADIAMPVEDGYTMLRRIRAEFPPPISALPAAALTAFAREDDRQAALHAGFQAHLAKPVDARSLVTAVASLAGAQRV